MLRAAKVAAGRKLELRVVPLPAGAIRPTSSSVRARSHRRLEDVRPGHALAGVQVEDHAVGLVDALRPVEFQVWNSIGVHLRRRQQRLGAGGQS